MSVPFIKIGSGDSNNIPMIEYAASKNIPLVISTGMINKSDVEKIYSTVKRHHLDFCILHCVSSYPTPFDECNLNVINDYKETFSDICIGYSGHEIGISVSLAAIALGAKVLERHLTLDKSLKGSDHCCSLLPNELTELIEQIRIIERAMGNPIKTITSSGRIALSFKLEQVLIFAFQKHPA
jgi:sialic acid synthase